jgi:protein gp37
MGKESSIQWTDSTWNVARGCTKVDEDCKFCYMYRDSMDSTRYNPLNVVRTKTVFNLPLRLKEPSKIFTSSLTDFFHEAIDGYRNEAWDIIRQCPQHTFQILTKRPERIMEHLPEDWGDGWDNVWLGTSVGSQKAIKRLHELEEVTAKTTFVSFEPLHTEITQSFVGRVDWIIIGGESGNEKGKYRYRPCEIEWIENIIRGYREAGKEGYTHETAIFVKQLGTHLSKQLGLKDRHGGDINEWPEHLRIREFPKSIHLTRKLEGI